MRRARGTQTPSRAPTEPRKSSETLRRARVDFTKHENIHHPRDDFVRAAMQRPWRPSAAHSWPACAHNGISASSVANISAACKIGAEGPPFDSSENLGRSNRTGLLATDLTGKGIVFRRAHMELLL